MTAEQLRAARAMLRMEQSELARLAHVSVETIKRLERMDGDLMSVRVATINAIEAAFQKAGITFVPDNGEGPGVRLQKSVRQ